MKWFVVYFALVLAHASEEIDERIPSRYRDTEFRLFRKRWTPELDKNGSKKFLAASSNLLATCQRSLRETEDILVSSAQITAILSDATKLNLTSLVDQMGTFSHYNHQFKSTENISDMDISIFHKLSELMEAIKNACKMLPKIASTFQKDNDIEKLLESFIIWTEVTVSQIEAELYYLFNAYERHPDMDTAIEKIRNIMKEMTENESFKDLFEFTIEIMKDMKKDAPHSIKRMISKLENILMPLGDLVQGPNDDEFWIANFHDVPATNLLTEEIPKFVKSPNKYIYGEVEIDTTVKIAELPPEFLSMAIGSKLIQKKFQKIPKQKERFLNLASLFTPSILRVGGSAANFLTYDPTREENDVIPTYKGWGTQEEFEMAHLHPKFLSANKHHCIKQLEKKDFTNFTMTGADWDFLIGIAKELEWPILFDVNQMKRLPDGSWDSSNAELLFNDHATQDHPIIWQLGNEPNSYKHLFGWSIEPKAAAEDYIELRRKVESNLAPVGPYFVVGPDVTRPRKLTEAQDPNFENVGQDSMKFLRSFLNGGDNLVDAVTWHQYYMDGRTATTKDFLSVEMMNRFPKQVSEIVAIRDSFAPSKPIWLTETANAWGGGAPELSGGFAGTFLWLDKLGASAFGGISMVFRQTLVGGCYGLIDRDLNPTSNYWVSALHKEIVGQTVLLPRVRMASENVRLYAHCLKPTNYLYKKGAIVIFGMNVGDEPQSIKIVNEQLRNSDIYIYRLTAPFNDMTSSSVLLNGELLAANDDGVSPAFSARLLFDTNLSFLQRSISFFVFPDANNALCL